MRDLCPGSRQPVRTWTRVTIDGLGVTMKTSRCEICGQRVLVQVGRMVEHPKAPVAVVADVRN